MASNDDIQWERERMPVVQRIREEYREENPFAGLTIGVATHVEQKTGVYVEALLDAGAEVLFTATDFGSIQQEVVDVFAERENCQMYAWEGMDQDDLTDAYRDLVAQGPDILLDDGSVLVTTIHSEYPDLAADVIGACEQTTSGIHRVQAMDEEGRLEFPIFEVNHARMKWNFDNVHGTGESALANLMLTTNDVIAGSTIVIAGYGHVGRGIAAKARALGAQTIVTEVDPCAAMEAHMQGHQILPMVEAAERADVLVTATGNTAVLRREHIEQLPDNVVLANAGHFAVEIEVDTLEEMAERTSAPRDGITRYHLPDGRRVNLLTEGHLLNLTGPKSEGHPAEVMDITFAMMLRSTRELLQRDLSAGLHGVPPRLDREVGERKLQALGIEHDSLTSEQKEYLSTWQREE